jgi:hypothetical protein
MPFLSMIQYVVLVFSKWSNTCVRCGLSILSDEERITYSPSSSRSLHIHTENVVSVCWALDKKLTIIHLCGWTALSVKYTYPQSEHSSNIGALVMQVKATLLPLSWLTSCVCCYWWKISLLRILWDHLLNGYKIRRSSRTNYLQDLLKELLYILAWLHV